MDQNLWILPFDFGATTVACLAYGRLLTTLDINDLLVYWSKIDSQWVKHDFMIFATIIYSVNKCKFYTASAVYSSRFGTVFFMENTNLCITGFIGVFWF